MGLKELAKTGLEHSGEKKYEKLLLEKTESYNDWIVRKEACLECEDGFDSHTTDIIVKYNKQSFHVVSMEECRFGFNVRQYIEDIIIFTNGSLSSIAIPLISDFFDKHQKAIVVYGDEDIIDEKGLRTNPFFKPDFSPNEFLKHFYFCNIVAIRRSAFREMDFTGEMTGAASLYHNLLRMIYSDKKYIDYGVGRVEGVLIHACDYHNEEIMDESAAKFASKMKSPELAAKKGAERSISVVICTKDHPDMLRTCLESLDGSKGNFNVEYIVVDNGSNEVSKAENNAIASKIPFTYIYEPAEFNFSAMCNLGASKANGDMLLFLNDDVEISDVGVLEGLWNEASYSFTGASGIKLLYPENGCIQHAGIVNTAPGPVHKLQGMKDNKDYYHGFNRTVTNRIGVTGACLCMRRNVFEAVQGFDTEFPVAYNDVDLCYRLLESGMYIACCNDVFAIHKESVTRGADVSEEKAARLLCDRDRLYRIHPHIGRRDPFFNKYLLTEALDARIVPANEYNVDSAAEEVLKTEFPDLSDGREDACLKIGVEFAGSLRDFLGVENEDSLLQGYGVLTGSNNACYTKAILLSSESGVYSLPCTGCVRNDIKEAFPEEKNVELSGFSFRIPKGVLPMGSYRVGMVFKRDFSKEKIYCYTDKYLVIGE